MSEAGNNRIAVSFCVPVYNNAEAAAGVVKGLLSCGDSRFEVVVCDDNSAEDVRGALSEIHDERLKYYRNKKNLGAHKNWEHSLTLGRGEWLYLVMARDIMHGGKIPRLIEILDDARKNNITYIKDGYIKSGTYSGIDAMINFIVRVHPTGDIYDAELFRKIPEREKHFEMFDMFPENYIRHNLLLKGGGSFIMSGVHIWAEPKLIDFHRVISGVDKRENVFDCYFAPRRTTIQNLENLAMVDADSSVFSRKELDRYFRANFSHTIHCVSVLWQGKCADSSWMSHYGHETRRVGVREISGNILTAYRAVKSYLREHGTYSASRGRIMKSIAAKWLVYSVLRTTARRVAEVFGLWKILQAVKKRIQ